MSIILMQHEITYFLSSLPPKRPPPRGIPKMEFGSPSPLEKGDPPETEESPDENNKTKARRNDLMVFDIDDASCGI